MFAPVARATAVIIWVPGVDGAVKVYEKTLETPTLEKLVKWCPGACGGATGLAMVTSCAKDMAVEPLTGTSGVVPITEPSNWDHSKSLVSAVPGQVQLTGRIHAAANREPSAWGLMLACTACID